MLRQGLSTLLAPMRKFAGRTAASAAGKAVGGSAPMGTAADAVRAAEPWQPQNLAAKMNNAVKSAEVSPIAALASRMALMKKSAGVAAPKSGSALSAAKKPAKAPSKAKKTIKKVNQKAKTKKAVGSAVKAAPSKAPKAKRAVKPARGKPSSKPSKAKQVTKKK